MKWTELTNVKDILRHRRGLGLTRNENAATAGVSAGTVTNVLKRLRRRGCHAGRFRMVSTTRRSGNCSIRAANRTADTPSPAGTRSSGNLTPRPAAVAKSDRGGRGGNRGPGSHPDCRWMRVHQRCFRGIALEGDVLRRRVKPARSRVTDPRFLLDAPLGTRQIARQDQERVQGHCGVSCHLKADVRIELSAKPPNLSGKNE